MLTTARSRNSRKGSNSGGILVQSNAYLSILHPTQSLNNLTTPINFPRDEKDVFQQLLVSFVPTFVLVWSPRTRG